MPLKLGPRPKDFDEVKVRTSPTFQKWMALQPGQDLRYACREYVKGFDDDEERLMRRIMIARRNNLKDHATLKRARDNGGGGGGAVDGSGSSTGDIKQHPHSPAPAPSSRSTKRRQKNQKYRQSKEEDEATGEVVVVLLGNDCRVPKKTRKKQRINRSDEDIIHEMDMEAVEATRSYQKWAALPNDATFVYNHTFTKGNDGDDWLLKRIIWRRMRYRRQNRDKVYELNRVEGGGRSRRIEEEGVGVSLSAIIDTHNGSSTGTGKVEEELENGIIEDEDESALVSNAVRDTAAVAQLELGLVMQGGVHSLHPTAAGIDAVAVAALDDPIVVSALDAAAQLAASAVACLVNRHMCDDSDAQI